MSGVAGHSAMGTPEGVRDGVGLLGEDHDLAMGMEESLTAPGSAKRKRGGPLVDEVTEMPAKQIREQLQDTSDIVRDWVPLNPKKAKKKKKDQAASALACFDVNQPAQRDLPKGLQNFLRKCMIRKSLDDPAEQSLAKRHKSLSPEQARNAAQEDIQGIDMDAPEEQLDDPSTMPMGEEEEMYLPGGGIDDFGGDDAFSLGEAGYTPAEPASMLDDQTQAQEEVNQTAVDKRTGWSARTKESLNRLRKSLSGEQENIAFSEVVEQTPKGAPRRKAAQQFFEMLVLHSRSFVRLKQPEMLGEIMVAPGDNFNSQTVQGVQSHA